MSTEVGKEHVITHVSLFTGIGGLDLAAEWAGFKTVLQVERDPYCLRVLAKHWPDVTRMTDVKDVTHESVDRPITVVSGGFPCQPFSAAGKRGSTSDDRHLWPQMLRIVQELRPLYVVGENVSGLLSIDGGLVFETVCADLEREGYDVLPFHYPAASVGAPHRRDRVFIVAHRNTNRKGEPACAVDAEVAELSGNVADTEEPRLERWNISTASGVGFRLGQSSRAIGNHWESEPDVGRVAHGIPHRVDRLRALGNAVVPAQAYPIFKAIAEVESEY